MARISVGTVIPVPKGDYSPTATYNRLNWVKYNGALYCCKANGVVGVSPENTEFWMKQLDAPTDADGVSYDNSTSGLEADKVQGAIDEVVGITETLNEDLGTLNTNLSNEIALRNAELEVLGWNVPKECPIQNTLSNGVLTQNVGRVDLGKLGFGVWENYWRCEFVDTKLASVGYTNNYAFVQEGSYNIQEGQTTITGSYYSSSPYIIVNNGSSTTKPNGYLYYELATPITHTVSDTSSVQEMISDEWKSGSSSTYKAGEYKIYNNVLKKCLIDCNGSVSFDNDAYWKNVSVGDELKEEEISLPSGSVFARKKGSFVTLTIVYNGNVSATDVSIGSLPGGWIPKIPFIIACLCSPTLKQVGKLQVDIDGNIYVSSTSDTQYARGVISYFI